jgi:hypothetical protein
MSPIVLVVCSCLELFEMVDKSEITLRHNDFGVSHGVLRCL